MSNASRRLVAAIADNTLLDNDRVAADLKRYFIAEVGEARAQQYWEIFEELRNELGYADYLGALQRYRMRYQREPHLLALSSYLVNYPFANRLFPGSVSSVRRRTDNQRDRDGGVRQALLDRWSFSEGVSSHRLSDRFVDR